MCPCCSNTLLRYAHPDGLHLFCPHCWAEMPDLIELYQDLQPADRPRPEGPYRSPQFGCSGAPGSARSGFHARPDRVEV
jgi:hypothetical protein